MASPSLRLYRKSAICDLIRFFRGVSESSVFAQDYSTIFTLFSGALRGLTAPSLASLEKGKEMLKSIMAAIGRMLAAMPKFVTERVKVAGRWITRLVAVPAAPVMPNAGVAAEAKADLSAKTDDSHAVIRRVGGKLVQGQELTADDLKGVTPQMLRWLRVLGKPALCRVLCADEQQLRAHIRGVALIKGVCRYEPEAIEAMEAANRPAPTPEGRKTLREVLAEKGLHP